MVGWFVLYGLLIGGALFLAVSKTALADTEREIITDWRGDEVEVEHRFITLKNGMRLHFVVAGEHNWGEPVVLLHGFPDFWYGWRNQIVALAKSGFRVFAPDMRGYNRSDKPRRKKHYRQEKLTEDIKLFIEEILRVNRYDRVQLVGHDWGAFVAWSVATEHPELIATLTTFAVPHPKQTSHVARYFYKYLRQVLKSWYVAVFKLRIIPEFIIKDVIGLEDIFDFVIEGPMVNADRITDEDRRRYMKAWSKKNVWRSTINYYRASKFFFGGDFPSWHNKIPVTVIFCTQDISVHTPIFVDDIKDYVPNAFVYEVDSSHFVQVDDPEYVTRTILRTIGHTRRD